MASFYADENFNKKVVSQLTTLGHDILTAQQAGQAGKGKSDPEVLAYAIQFSRAVLTHNRRHFIKLHKSGGSHNGIVVCTNDRDYFAVSQRIHKAVAVELTLNDKLLRINKPSKP